MMIKIFINLSFHGFAKVQKVIDRGFTMAQDLCRFCFYGRKFRGSSSIEAMRKANLKIVIFLLKVPAF